MTDEERKQQRLQFQLAFDGIGCRYILNKVKDLGLAPDIEKRLIEDLLSSQARAEMARIELRAAPWWSN